MHVRIRHISLALMLMFSGGARAEHEIGFVEKFALAKDRAAALQELIPGTEEYYFYHALHFQNTAQKKELATILGEWTGRAPESPLLREIQHRESLINYETDPQATLVYLKRTLEVEFNHAQQIPNAKPNLPTTLDQQLIAPEAFQAQATKQGQSLEGLRRGSLETMLRNNVPLNIAQLRQLLKGLERPDIPGLTEAILKELADEQSGGFGSLPIHGNLLLNQMEALAKGRPELKNSASFIHKWLEKLQPSAEVNLSANPPAREAWLEQAWAFAKDLPPSFNSLKAHLLYHRLKHDWEAGKPSVERFVSYLKLPRNTPQVSSAFKRDESHFEFPCNLSESFEPMTKLPTVENDEALVRNYLLHFLEAAADVKAFAPYVEESYLRQAYAESNLVAGKGDAEKWFSIMSASEIESLRERVDLDFDPTNRWKFKPEEDVALALQVKNVPDIAVHIFEINTLNYYKSGPPAPFPNLNLDGLIANHQQSAKYAEAPVLRKKREFKFPEIEKKRGVWVIDFVGNGKLSRAVICKGQLHVTTRISSAGTAVTVLDEAFQAVPQATIIIDGKEFKTGETKEIILPFSNQPGPRSVIVTDGNGFAETKTIELAEEKYNLYLSAHVPQESLITGKKATAIIRANLSINETPIAISILEKAKLTISAQNLDGVETRLEAENFALKANEESTVEFTVPERLESVTFTLDASVQNLTTGATTPLKSERRLEITPRNVKDSALHSRLLLGQTDGKYFVQRLGLSGEPLAEQSCTVKLFHPDFENPVEVQLKTDATGTMQFGVLAGIDAVAVTSGSDQAKWNLPKPQAASVNRGTIHVAQGQPILLPWFEATDKIDPNLISLLEMKGGVFVRDVLSDKTTKIKAGYLVINRLEPGEYSLQYGRDRQTFRIQVSAGKLVGNQLIGEGRVMQLAEHGMLQLLSAKQEADNFIITLGGAGADARVHVVASRFVPETNLFSALRPISEEPLMLEHIGLSDGSRWHFLPARTLGDEVRYILDRRSVKKFPGNMMPRPSLLLNPWATKDVSFSEQQLRPQGDEDGEMNRGRGVGADGFVPVFSSKAPPNPPFSFDFLAQPGVALFNLKPDKDGIIVLKRSAFGDRQFIRIVALDGESTVTRDVSLPDAETKFRDVRFADGLDPKGHFSLQNEVTVLEKDVPLTIANVDKTKFQLLDDLGKAFTLYESLRPSEELRKFDFVVKWPTFDEARKRELYSEHACHELNFFLSRKDPGFFKQIVLSYLKNKRDQTFLDHYLLGHDLKEFLSAWNYRQLNTVEKILLAQRHPEEANETSAEIREIWEHHVPNFADEARRFEAALGTTSLAGGTTEELGMASPAAAEPQDEKTGLLIKLKNITIPRIQFKDAPFEEVLNYLRQKSIELDTIDPNKSGVNFILKNKGRPTPDTISLDLRDVPLIVVLDQVTQLANMSYRVESHVVVISALTGAGNSLQTRVYRVPPGFAKSARHGVKAVLMALGANFDAAGSDATYLPGSGRLVVKNTLQQLDYIEKTVGDMAKHPDIPDDLALQYSPADPFAATPEKSDSDQLKQGYGYFDLGQYNEAMEAFNKVLAVDPQNVSARRGLERTERQIDEYLQSSRDHTRAHMLRNVDELWETSVPRRVLMESDKEVRRKQADRFYRKLGATKELAENNYYQLPMNQQGEGLVGVNGFWKDYAAWDGKGGFLSARLAEASGNFTEILFALAVLDLPFPSEIQNRRAEIKDRSLTVTPLHRSLLFRRELKATQIDPEAPKLLVNQRFYRMDEKGAPVRGKNVDKNVTSEFLTGVVYEGEVVVTNPTDADVTVEILLQLPMGAMPILGGQPTINSAATIGSHGATTVNFSFYFPRPGEYLHHPAEVSKDGKVVAFAEPTKFKVVNELTSFDKGSWAYVSQFGTGEQVLEFIKHNNMRELPLEDIAWRCQDAAFFAKLVPVLEKRRLFNETLWSYSLKHTDARVLREYLCFRSAFLEQCGPILNSKLATIDPVKLKTYEHLEYSPLVNARVHHTGSQPTILNKIFRGHYVSFLNILAHQPTLQAEDRLAATSYLLTQDRVEEAIEMMATVQAKDVREQLQFDYLQAVLAWQQADAPTARKLAAAHAEEPVNRWREKFVEIIAQLDEMDGGAPKAEKADQREQVQNELASRDPSMELSVEGNEVTVKSRNLTEITVNYYPMDLEFLFSAAPFVSSDPQRFGLIQPMKTERVTLAADKPSSSFPLPKEYQNSNVLVQINGAGKSESKAHFANELNVVVSESHGLLQVLHAKDKRPLPKTYVKVFAEVNGEAKFHKDGYTDLRGKFDYISLSGSETKATRYSLLIMSEKDGAKVIEVAAPKQ